jgi:Ca2+-binding RTX toxin-like protein
VLQLSLDSNASDGEPGEGDNLGADVENVLGGTGRNVIVGNSLANVLTGGQSNDTIGGADGISGNDRVIGSFGTDLCASDPGDFEDCEI